VLARSIFNQVENLQTSGELGHEAVRRLLPWLPSFSEEFTASVPLTRIRDIAHRSDLPHDIKQEIKHTIQNKLHRCAGPEDLVATEAMLLRITGQGNQRDGHYGNYPEDFVREFRLFHRELKDFFNASSLEERLERIRPYVSGEIQQMIDGFMNLKSDLQAGAQADQLISVLGSLSALREAICVTIQGHVPQDISDSDIAHRQQLRLSELELEKFSFVLLSQLETLTLQEGGLAPGGWAWAPALRGV